jgi:allantoin racemase
MKIRVVTPIVTKDFVTPEAAEEYAAAVGPEHEVSVVAIDRGPASIESEYDEALAAPDVIAKICEAEKDGIDAVVINCFGDPGMKPSREAVAIPVVGSGEASMHLAAGLGHKFSVVTVLENVLPMLYNECKLYGLEGKTASVRSVDIPVLDLHVLDQEKLAKALVSESIKAIDEDGAHVIVLGCTGMTGLSEAVREGLAEQGYDIPVVDPLIAALKTARILVEMDLSHSKRTYPYPPEKEIVGYDISRPLPVG